MSSEGSTESEQEMPSPSLDRLWSEDHDDDDDGSDYIIASRFKNFGGSSVERRLSLCKVEATSLSTGIINAA